MLDSSRGILMSVRGMRMILKEKIKEGFLIVIRFHPHLSDDGG